MDPSVKQLHAHYLEITLLMAAYISKVFALKCQSDSFKWFSKIITAQNLRDWCGFLFILFWYMSVFKIPCHIGMRT